MKYQLGALWAFAQSHGLSIQHVKPHGAIYNMAAVDEKLAIAMCEAVYEVDKDIIFAGSEAGFCVELERARHSRADGYDAPTPVSGVYNRAFIVRFLFGFIVIFAELTLNFSNRP